MGKSYRYDPLDEEFDPSSEAAFSDSYMMPIWEANEPCPGLPSGKNMHTPAHVINYNDDGVPRCKYCLGVLEDGTTKELEDWFLLS